MSESPGDQPRSPGALSALFTGKAEDGFSNRPSASDPDSPTERERQIMHGQLAGTIAGVQERYHVAGKSQEKTLTRENRRKQRESDLIFILDALRRDLDRLEAAVAAYEQRFADRFGDAWREEIALEILGADTIPQQRGGEGITDYRERLETVLVDRLLHDDGKIRAEYAANPSARDYAQWAQARFHENQANSVIREIEDSNTTPERRDQLLGEVKARGSLEEMTFADRGSRSSTLKIRDVVDSHLDDALQRNQEFAAADFLSSSSPLK